MTHPIAQQMEEPHGVEEALAPELNGLPDHRPAAGASAETRFRYFQEVDADGPAPRREIGSTEEALSTK